MAKKKEDTNRDELTGILADSLNKKFSKTHHRVAYFLDGSEDSPTDVNDWVSTGSTVLDLAISNRPNGGFPVSKIVEITGLEQSGKSLLASHIIANTQKKDGVAVYIDTESSLNSQFLQAIGVDVEKMVYLPLETVEDIMDLYKRYEFDEMKDILQGWLKPTDEDGGKETEKVQPQGKVDINKKLDNLFD